MAQPAEPAQRYDPTHDPLVTPGPGQGQAYAPTWWVASAGGALDTYAPGGVHMRPFADFVAPIEHTARFCGMHWLPPFVVHGGHSCSTQQLANARSGLLAQLAQHLATRPSTAAPSPVSQQTTQVHP